MTYIEDEVVVVVVVDMAASEAGAISDVGAMASAAGEVTAVDVSVVVEVSSFFEQAAADRHRLAAAAMVMILAILRIIVIPSHQDVKRIWRRGCMEALWLGSQFHKNLVSAK
ncbi:hypothetical protein AEAC466_07100 [Asticcacaulis sp. AC466]|nr:hypothetical protein AEAC466_07100 [Asticcacaulis sp. AC466]